MTSPLVAMRGIGKTYGAVRALHHVDSPWRRERCSASSATMPPASPR